jgi:hypothetical protein
MSRDAFGRFFRQDDVSKEEISESDSLRMKYLTTLRRQLVARDLREMVMEIVSLDFSNDTSFSRLKELLQSILALSKK